MNGRPTFTSNGPFRFYPCAICSADTLQAIRGNVLIDRWKAYHDRKEMDLPPLEWRCRPHARYKMRGVKECHANTYGDLIVSLECGHEAKHVFRGALAYTHGMAKQAAEAMKTTRCYLCGQFAS